MFDSVEVGTVFPACCTYGHVFSTSQAIFAFVCLRVFLVLLVQLQKDIRTFLEEKFSMGNENSSIPSGSSTPTSDWQSLYSYGSARPGRRSSLGSTRIPSPVEPPEPDLSHLSPEEIAQIQAVIGRAKELKDEDSRRIKKLEEEYVSYAADVERRNSEAVAAAPDRKDTPLCPICLKNELHIKEGRMKEGQNVCVDCGNLICLECGKMESSIATKTQEWVCHVCTKRRQLVLTSGMWHPGCNIEEDIPLAREMQTRLERLEKKSRERGPLIRSASADASKIGPEKPPPKPASRIRRQTSLPDYSFNPSFSADSHLDSIKEGPQSPVVSQEASSVKTSPGSDETRMSGSGSKLKGMSQQPISRSDSEYSDIASDVDMEDVSMLRYGVDVSPDDGSDDYSLMSIGSSDDSGKMLRKHRPKSLNLSRSHSATSSEDETTDSAMSTDVESKYSAVAAPDVNDIRIALAASAFVEDMRVDMSHDTDEEVSEMTSLEVVDEGKLRFSPSAPISPSWREGLESPPFSPRRRDSYPGKRRGSSPVSPKDKHFTYTDISPPSHQLSLEEMYESQTQASAADNASHVPFAQRPSPKSPDELHDSFYNTPGNMNMFNKPATSMKKSKPFYSLETAQDDLGDSTVIDLATYAASVASSTANLTSMTVSPTNVTDYGTGKADDPSNSKYRGEGRSSTSPGYYDNVPSDEGAKSSGEEDDIELADPSQKSIDYQGSKRQKARPPNTDWSPVIDLSPILDVSPSLEEAEQAEMLAQQEERKRQESKEELDEDVPPSTNVFTAAEGQEDVDYKYYGLKRYERVEDISELLKQNNGALSDERSSEKEDVSDKKSTDEDEHDLPDASFVCTSLSSATNTTTSISTSGNSRESDREAHKHTPLAQDENAMGRNETKSESKSKPTTVKHDNQNTGSPSRGKARRKLPQPTAEIIATQRAPVPKPRKRDKSSDPPPKPARLSRPEHAAPSTTRGGTKNKTPSDSTVQKQDSEERRKTAKGMKAKPDPVLIKHIETEEASASPQYKVLDSPPSPETKSMVRREYSDSTSVSPTSSPDRDIYLYPSPVTPPDSDSSPPKPHSPSSGTDFEEEGAFMEAANLHTREVTHKRTNSREDTGDASGKSMKDKIRMFEKEQQKTQGQAPQTGRSKLSNAQREAKQRDMKKIRRKLPQIPSDEESPQHKAKGRGQSPRKTGARNDPKLAGRKKFGTPSASDDSSMNEDDYEVATINRKKCINDLDKPSMDKQNGNYLQITDSTNSSRSSSNSYTKSDEYLKANIPPDDNEPEMDVATAKYRNETDLIIDSMINIYGAPITNAMKSLKKRLQEEVRRVTEGRKRWIEEFEEIQALKLQIGELKLGTDAQKKMYESRTSGKGASAGNNGKKRSTSSTRSNPQVLPRRARHKRQSSDPMVAKFSPIKEDKDIEAEIQGRSSEDPKGSKDDSSLSGLSDNDSIRSEPVLNSRQRKAKASDYAKIFLAKQAQSVDRLDQHELEPTQMISSHSEGNIPLNTEDHEYRMREEKVRELQYEIEKRKRQLASTSSPKISPKPSPKKEASASNCNTSSNRPPSGPKHPLAHSCDEIPRRTAMIAPYLPPRPIPTGIIKPIDDDDDDDDDIYCRDYVDDYKPYYQNQSYSSTEYLAHKQEEMLKQRFDELGAYSSPFLYSGDIGEKSAFVPQVSRTTLDVHSYSTGNVNVKDVGLSGSVTLPEMHTVRSDMQISRGHQGAASDTESSPPHEVTPAMPLLTDITARSRKIIHEIGTGSRPVSAEFNLGVEELMNGMSRVESDNSVDADEPIMKHMMEGGVTILKQLERRKQPPPAKPKKYAFPTKKILLTSEPKERTTKGPGRHGNGIGMKIVGGKQAPDTMEVGAYVAAIYKGGVAEQLHGELQEGDQILEWNGIELSGKSYEEVQQIISHPNGEIELVVRPRSGDVKKILGDTTAQAPSCHSSYDNLDSDEDNEARFKGHQGVDPKQLAAQLEGIQESESPSLSQSSSQHDCRTPSASSACSSPRSDPTSTSSDQRHRPSNTNTNTNTTTSSNNTSATNSLSVESGEKIYVTTKMDRPERPERRERPERPEHSNRGDRRDNGRYSERSESAERQDRFDTQERHEKNEYHFEKMERRERPHDVHERMDIDRGDYYDRSERHERPGSRSYDRSIERPIDRFGDRSMDRSNDIPMDRSGDRYIDRPMDRSGDRSGDRSTDRPMDRPMDRSGDRYMDRPMDRSGDRSGDRSMDRPMDRPMDRSGDRSGDRSMDRPMDRPMDRSGDRYMDRPMDKSFERSVGRAPESPIERQSDKPLKADRFDRHNRPSKMDRNGKREKLHDRSGKFVNDFQATKPVLAPKPIQENDIQTIHPRGERQMGDIQIKLNHDEKANVFNINVIQARNLLPKDLNGLSDPFVKIYMLPGRCSENKRRTKHIARTLNPEWKETVVFPNVHREELKNKTLEVTVWDYDRFKTNDFLGEVVLDLSANEFLDNTAHWYPLCEHDDSRGMELPRPTVLPPRSGGPSPGLNKPSPSPRAKSKDRLDKNVQSGGHRDERIWHGLGRRRRSLGTLADVDKLQTNHAVKASSARTSPFSPN